MRKSGLSEELARSDERLDKILKNSEELQRELTKRLLGNRFVTRTTWKEVIYVRKPEGAVLENGDELCID